MSVNIIAAECLYPTAPNVELADIAIKTQFSLVKKHPFFVDRCGERIKASYFSAIKAMDETRWSIMAKEILTNLKEKLVAFQTPKGYRLWLILPDREGVPNDIEKNIIDDMSIITNKWDEIHVLKGSHAQSGLALQKIMLKQQAKNSPQIFDIVLGLDSYIMTETLMYLESDKRIHNSYYFDSNNAVPNPYGFVPSEGAAVIVLTSGLAGIGCLKAVATGYEEHLRNSDEPCVGAGLTQTAKKALKEAKSQKLSYIISDVNGEPYRADEYGFTVAKLNPLLDDYSIIVPALSTGDLGCVSLLMNLAVMIYQYKIDVEYHKYKHILILSSSEDHLRSAVVLSE